MHSNVYADFHNLDGQNRLRLTCMGTREDLARQHIDLREGLVLTFCMDDADDDGNADELRVEGTVQRNEEEGCWVAAVDWRAVRHASDESNGTPDPAKVSRCNGQGVRDSGENPAAAL